MAVPGWEAHTVAARSTRRIRSAVQNSHATACCAVLCVMLHIWLYLCVLSPHVNLLLQGALQLYSWSEALAGSSGAPPTNTNPGAQQALHTCNDLAQLAMWLGVGKVRLINMRGLNSEGG